MWPPQGVLGSSRRVRRRSRVAGPRRAASLLYTVLLGAPRSLCVCVRLFESLWILCAALVRVCAAAGLGACLPVSLPEV